MRMNICVSANSKSMRYLYVMLLSLFENNKEEKFTVFVMQRDFTSSGKKMIQNLADRYGQKTEFLFVDKKRFDGLPVSEKFSLETYFRLMMAELLPQTIHKVLYLDVDIIVRGSIKEFYETEIDAYTAAACQDSYNPVLEDKKRKLFQRKDDMRYFNAGVMLWNMDALREAYRFEDFMDAARKLGFELQYADQEILNFMLYNRILYCAADQYNYIVWGEAKESDLREGQAVIMHYAGCNPWQDGQKNDLYRIWWDYAKRTPFYVELLEENLWRETGFASEKEELILRDIESREIYKFAFHLKGCGRILASVKAEKKNIIIYGTGTMGEVLYEILAADNAWNYVKGVVDQSKSGSFHGIEISKEMNGNTDDVMIVTPVYRSRELINHILDEAVCRIHVVSLKEWLSNIA